MKKTKFEHRRAAQASRAYDPRFMYMLPSAKISVMGGTQASEVLSLVKYKNKGNPEEVEKFKDAIVKNYDA